MFEQTVWGKQGMRERDSGDTRLHVTAMWGLNIRIHTFRTLRLLILCLHLLWLLRNYNSFASYMIRIQLQQVQFSCFNSLTIGFGWILHKLSYSDKLLKFLIKWSLVYTGILTVLWLVILTVWTAVHMIWAGLNISLNIDFDSQDSTQQLNEWKNTKICEMVEMF